MEAKDKLLASTCLGYLRIAELYLSVDPTGSEQKESTLIMSDSMTPANRRGSVEIVNPTAIVTVESRDDATKSETFTVQHLFVLIRVLAALSHLEPTSHQQVQTLMRAQACVLRIWSTSFEMANTAQANRFKAEQARTGKSLL